VGALLHGKSGPPGEYNRHERWIAAPPARIFAILSDPAAFTRLIPPYTRVTFDRACPYRPGVRLTIHIDHLLKFTWHSEVRQVEPNRRIELEFLDGLFQGGTEIWELKPEGTGTRVMHTIIVSPRGRVRRLIWRLKGRERHDALVEQFLDNLKAAVTSDVSCINNTARPCCMLCRGGRFREILRRGGFHYLRCAACKLVYLWPQPSPGEIIDAYEEYLPADDVEIAHWRRMMQPVIRRSADLICGAKPDGGRLLDIGCGYGFFLAEMARRGWRTQGVEIASAGIRHAREKLNLAVASQPLEHLDWPANRFDAITLFYVIEHLGDPAATLAILRRWLKPDGVLLLRWPHSTPIVRLLGPLAGRLDLYHTPFHMFDFSPSTIRTLLVRCGFDRINTTIGGYTLPSGAAARLCSRLFGGLALAGERLSGGRLLLPGVSKTTLARRSDGCHQLGEFAPATHEEGAQEQG
jgi:SAM-dependent methyltransferase/uncharacterized protein YndB with AHSA1/START domain